jgi:hypothetical protein
MKRYRDMIHLHFHNLPQPDATMGQERFFINHDIIHDRVTGAHITTNPDSIYQDGINKCCALLNDLARTNTASQSQTPPAWASQMLDILSSIAERVGALEKEIEMVDRSIDEVLADVADEKTQIGGLTKILADTKAKLADVLAQNSGSIPPDVQAKINAVFDGIESNKADVMAAINKNTPAANVDPAASGAPTA